MIGRIIRQAYNVPYNRDLAHNVIPFDERLFIGALHVSEAFSHHHIWVILPKTTYFMSHRFNPSYYII